MKVKLRDEDRQAMDLLLDQSATAAGKAAGTAVYAAASGHIRERVVRVQKVLSLLDELPASDPPRDLMARTLRYVEQSATQPIHADRESAPPLFNNRPPVA
ncbi:MAG: hypothetical protein JWL69_630 [Phycisphaerales bacterium]|nr:hypothetical protein [Phycisphaerales bacterium]MDB5356147.1 hypothetical protein [Phycisphaerales bacterium]